ncbi:MAG: carboxypeptidase regulatory-like domain-containing protein [Opitutaceae bacterium]|nr:carboxypeptidase regulatory-like domain-containing protein [Opitutaceae bacterium]
MIKLRILLTLGLLLAAARPAIAWGPHPKINSAARETLPPNSPLRAALGETLFVSLDRLCSLADWRRDVRPDFFPDDYLLFPASPQDRDHLVPEVRKTYAPFFRRTLWALRHETPENAARWMGSLLHYVSDTGSPPHAASVRGPLHSPMEGWVDSDAIRITGYTPRLLGDTDEAALQGFLARMEEVIAYCQVRGAKLSATMDLKEPRRNLPAALECALESARVTADVLYTLGERLRIPEPRGSTLQGRVLLPASGRKPEYLPEVGTHVVLMGTDWATVMDGDGKYEFRNLPVGTYRLGALHPGSTAAITEPVVLTEGKVRTRDILLSVSLPFAENRVRNADFALRWLRPDAPDAWRRLTNGYPERPPPQAGWQSENVAVTPGARYQVGAALRLGTQTRVVVRWRGHAMANMNVTEQEITNAAGESVTAPGLAKYLQILLIGDAADPSSLASRVWCVAETEKGYDPPVP